MKCFSNIAVWLAYAIVFLHAAIPHSHHGAESHLFSDEVKESEHHHNLLVSIFSEVQLIDGHLEQILLQGDIELPSNLILETWDIVSFLSFEVESQSDNLPKGYLEKSPPLPEEIFLSANFFRGPPCA
jgi:hypothetical protein